MHVAVAGALQLVVLLLEELLEQFARERYDQQMRTVIEDTLAAPVGTRW